MLAGRIAAGDHGAEAEFARMFRPGVLAMVRRQARPLDADGEDMAQEVMQSAISALRSQRLRDPTTLPAYLRASVVFTVRAHYRKQHRRGEDRAEPLDDKVEVNNDPQDNLVGHQLARLVRRLIGELHIDRDRQLLERFYLREQTKEQVCAELDISDEHFHRVAFRARERLRELLREAGVVA